METKDLTLDNDELFEIEVLQDGATDSDAEAVCPCGPVMPCILPCLVCIFDE